VDVSPINMINGSDVEKESIPDRAQFAKKEPDEDDVQFPYAEKFPHEDAVQLACAKNKSDQKGIQSAFAWRGVDQAEVKLDFAKKESAMKVNEIN
jgi:hypothetical protein